MTQQFSTVGQLATEPRLFAPPGGTEFCTFRLASTDRRFDAASGEWSDADTNWFTVNTFRSLARHAKQSFKKGDRVVVTGRLRVREWETADRRGTSVEIDAEGIGHDVRFGVTAFIRATGDGVRESQRDGLREAGASGVPTGASPDSPAEGAA